MNALKVEEVYIVKYQKALEGSTVLLEFLNEAGEIVCKKILKTTFWSTLLNGNLSMEPGQPTFLFKIRCLKKTTFTALRYTYQKNKLQITNTKSCGLFNLFPGDTIELNFNFRLILEDF